MKKVLVIGNVNSVFIDNLYKAIVGKSSDLTFYILNNKDQDSEHSQIKHLNTKKIHIPFFRKCVYLISFPLLMVLRLLFVKISMGSLNPMTHIRFIRRRFKDFCLAKYCEQTLQITEVHTQTIILDGMWLNFFFSSSIKKVYSIWGSDLLRVSNPYDYYHIHGLLKKSDNITVANIHVKEFLLVKYGRVLNDKIILNYFILSRAIFDKMDAVSIDDITKMKDSYHVDASQSVVIVGHSGDINDQHIEILKALETKMSEDDLNHFVFILPLAYGLTTQYKKKLQNYKKESSLNIHLQTEFLSFEDLAILKRLAHHVIMTPVSDANSAFVIESIYAGSNVIVGSWLPYGHHRQIGLPFQEIESFDQLYYCLNHQQERKYTQSEINSSIMSEYFSEEIVKGWINILE